MLPNFINLSQSDLDRPIYRVFTKERFSEMLITRKLVLVRPSLWEDPFENYIMNATGELKDGRLFKMEFRERFYGQCWTLKKESDALWRIYAPDENGIKVQTTIRKLFNVLYNRAGTFRDISCFIGKVRYYKKKELTDRLTDSALILSLITDTTGVGQARTLLFKRNAFIHEREVRLIYYAQKKIESKTYAIEINPTELFDRITIDPRCKYRNFVRLKKEFQDMGFDRPIIRSLLYKIPELSFKFDPYPLK